MKPFLQTLLALAAAAFLAARPAAAEQVLITGPDFAINGFARYVVTPLGWEAVKEEAPLPVSEYAKYRAVVFVEKLTWSSAREESFWNIGTNEATVRDYLTKGGKVILIGAAWPRKPVGEGSPAVRNLSMLQPLLGFSKYPNVKLVDPVHWLPAGEALFSPGPYAFIAPYSVTIGGLDGAQVLAIAQDENGVEHPFATVRAVGKGQVYWLSTSPFRLAREKGASDPAAKAYFQLLQKILQE